MSRSKPTVSGAMAGGMRPLCPAPRTAPAGERGLPGPPDRRGGPPGPPAPPLDLAKPNQACCPLPRLVSMSAAATTTPSRVPDPAPGAAPGGGRRALVTRRIAWTAAAVVALLVAIVLSLAVGARAVPPAT